MYLKVSTVCRFLYSFFDHIWIFPKMYLFLFTFLFSFWGLRCICGGPRNTWDDDVGVRQFSVRRKVRSRFWRQREAGAYGLFGRMISDLFLCQWLLRNRFGCSRRLHCVHNQFPARLLVDWRKFSACTRASGVRQFAEYHVWPYTLHINRRRNYYCVTGMRFHTSVQQPAHATVDISGDCDGQS